MHLMLLFRFSVNMNVIGVSRIVELCRKLDRLEVLVVISVSYVWYFIDKKFH